MSETTNTAMRAAGFIGTIGVNAHINDPNSSYATSNVIAQMSYLGIDNMRVSDYSGTQLSEYLAIGAAGIKFDAVTVIAPQNPINLANEMADLNEIAPYVISVEGPNEVNTDPVTYNGLTGAAAADAFQADLYNAVKADPALAGVQILPFSLSVGGSLTGFGNVTAYATEANVHGYASQGVPPYYFLNYAVSSVTTVVGEPVVMSETGYYTDFDGNSGVTQDVQAKWLMDTLLQNAADGVAKTYLYQLEDGYDNDPDDPEDNYGLFTVNGTPKQSAIDIHNLTSILADTGPNASTFTPGTLSYSVTGLNPDYGFQTVFAKSDGSFDIALWSEPQFYDAATGTEAYVAPSSVVVSLGGNVSISVYDPVLGTTAIQTATGSSITVALATDPLIIEVMPAAAATSTSSSGGSTASPPTGTSSTSGGSTTSAGGTTPATPPPASTSPTAATVIGSGSDTLALFMSEDAFQGDAQFTVSIDGQPVGGTLTATASHSDGAVQEFDVDAAFSAGTHVVTVDFLNDDYAGPGEDRNLYIASATINGQTISGAPNAIPYDGPVNFVFSVGASTPPVSVPVPPAVTGITAAASSTPAHAGQVISFTLALSEDVTVSGGGSPTLTLSTGGTAAYDAQQSTATSLVFTSTVAPGASSADLTVTGLSLNGASITGQSGLALSTAGVASPAGTGIAVATAIPTVTLGSGSKTLALAVSEDAYLGDAQFTIAVDGKQVGGVETAVALHGAGLSQVFDVMGKFAAGSHTVAVDFLNDAYAGTAATDRNLYVTSASLNGVAIAGGSLTEYSAGAQSFTFVVPKA